jgi:hypothetical protein
MRVACLEYTCLPCERPYRPACFILRQPTTVSSSAGGLVTCNFLFCKLHTLPPHALLAVPLQGAGGALHSKRELYQAAGQMVGALGDPYSEFMPPSQFRRALRRPLPAERNYLAAQYVGE